MNTRNENRKRSVKVEFCAVRNARGNWGIRTQWGIVGNYATRADAERVASLNNGTARHTSFSRVKGE